MLTEILRVSALVHNQGYHDFDVLHRGSPGPMAAPEVTQNKRSSGFNVWNDLAYEVSSFLVSAIV